MNESEILARLDERGRRAAASLRGATAGVDLAPPDPAFIRPPRRPVQRLLLVAAVIVVLGAGVATLVTRAHDRGRDGDPPADDRLNVDGDRLRLGATWLPAGMRPTTAGETELAGSNRDLGPVVLWGGPDLLAGVAGPSMLATTYVGLTTEHSGLESLVPGDPNLEVQGRSATFRSGLDAPIEAHQGNVMTVDGLNVLQFEPDGGRQAIVSSRQLDREALVRIAEAARLVDDELVFDPATLPEGWRALHEGAFADMPGGYGGPGGSVVEYDGGPGAASVLVLIGHGDRGRLDVLRAIAGEVQDIEVRGHEALTGHIRFSGPDPGSDRDWLVVIWEERPGVVVRLEGERIGLDELLRIAEGLTPLSDEEFAAIDPVWLSPAGTGGPVVADGTTGDGRSWALSAAVRNLSDTVPDSTLVVEFAITLEDGTPSLHDFGAGIAVSEIGPGTSAIEIRSHVGLDGAPMLYGLVPDRAVRVEARASDGSVTEAGLYDISDDRLGIDAVVVEPPIASTWVDVVAIDGDGSAIATTRVEILAG